MKSIKFLILTCIAISMSNCSSMKLTNTAPFKVTGATYYSWVGGQPGVNGVNLIIGVKDLNEVEFKSIYFRNRKVKISVEKRNDKTYIVANINNSPKMISETKTLTQINGGNVLDDKRNKAKFKRKTIPFNLGSNEAVIMYNSGKKAYYYKVSKIKKTKTVFYP